MEWSECTYNDEVYADLKKRVAAEQGDEHFHMQLVADDYAALAEAWNKGIDSHLEALTERSSVEQIGHKADCLIHPEELPVLIRRLFEGEHESAESLASGILHALNIEED
jgi:hypothetical protein